jgi:hypothetical protein
MQQPELHRRILEDLFYEQEHEALSNSYRHGLLRTLFVLGRSIFFAARPAHSDGDLIGNGGLLAVAFFDNELAAVDRAREVITIDAVAKYDIRSLSVVRQQLGLLVVCAELLYFCRLTLQVKGIGYLRRLSIPAIGWLLYRTFGRLLRNRSGVTVLTTNMVHPTSLGVSWAAVGAGQATVFYEHATTPQIIMKDRGYSRVYVNFQHTRGMLIAHGFDPQRIHVMQALEPAPAVLPNVVRTAAICINSYDSLPAITDIASVLRAHDLRVILRIHDADPRVSLLNALGQQAGFEIDLATQSKIQDFLRGIDLVITGNSNVIADALLAGRSVVYYWAGRADMFDYYGFVQHYGLAHATDRESLRRVIETLLARPQPC